MVDNQDSPNVALVKEYFLRVDTGEDVSPLFTEDFTFFYPKFGLTTGMQAFMEFATGLFTKVKSIGHPIATLNFIEQGDQLVAEGLFHGEMHSGAHWAPGETPAGRFCSVFGLRNGRIHRMHIYVDPDYAGSNAAGFLWGTDRKW
ncbi:MAG: hypothetical protein JWO15_2590 [Sphingomonadales bacterium]|nr:hypothetical protein [Sphingomonadales bacterium]